jgi:hypothetical protein
MLKRTMNNLAKILWMLWKKREILLQHDQQFISKIYVAIITVEFVVAPFKKET